MNSARLSMDELSEIGSSLGSIRVGAITDDERTLRDFFDQESRDVSETTTELIEIPVTYKDVDTQDSPSQASTSTIADKSTLPPRQHAVLRPSKQSTLFVWTLNIFLTVLPLLFLILAFLAARLDGSDATIRTNLVITLSQLGPTVYPILFTAIVGRLMCDVALYRAERGARLGTLEQLVQSQSLAGSLRIAVVLRNRSPWSWLITLVWLLSPIGGQSSLRLVSIEDGHNLRNETLIYASGKSMLNTGLLPSDGRAMVASTIQASLMASNTTLMALRDSWNNPKLPRVLPYDPSSLGDATQLWVRFAANNTDDYASIIGIPIWNVPSKGNTSFTIPFTTFSTDCVQDRDAWNNVCAENRSFDDPVCQLRRNGSVITSDWKGEQYVTTDEPQYMNLRVWVGCYDDLTLGLYSCLSAFNCMVESVHMEVQLLCDDGLCGASAFRKVANADPSFLVLWNTFDAGLNPGTRASYKSSWYSFIEYSYDILSAMSSGYTKSTTQVDRFLVGPYLGNTTSMQWDIVDDGTFSTRMSSVLNTYWLLSQYTTSISSRRADKVPSLRDNSIGGDEPTRYGPYSAVIATIDEVKPIFKAHKIWTVVLVYISLLLALCSISSIIMRIKTVAPDIFGFISSLTRDNIYFDHCRVGSTLNGGDRTRALQDMTVRIADVRPHEHVGRIAFTSDQAGADAGGLAYGRLRRNRFYN